MGRRVRLRDVPALPLLYLLHLVFTLSSLLLRLYEALRASVTSDNRDTGAAVSRSTTNAQPPRHVALVLALSGSSARKLSGTSRGKRQSARWREAAVESVRRAVVWAKQERVQHLSVYNAEGLLQAVVSELQSEYQPLPPSPPSSTASPSLPPQSHPYLSSPPDSSHEDELHDEGPRSSDSSLGKHSRTGRSAEVVLMRCGYGLQLHVLPSGRDVADLIPSITRDFIRAGTPTSDVTQQMIDAEVQARLHSPPPDLLLVHPLQPLSLWQSLLPRAAPELHGYPFWPLRITEIYQHPPPLPLHHLEPLFSAARRSTLPFVRKLGSLVQFEGENVVPDKPRRPADGQRESRRCMPGALRREEWEGAMEAWARVEQRLGK